MDILGEWAAQLSGALDRLGGRGAPVPADSRLLQSVALLQETANRGRMSDNALANGTGVNAIANARDFTEIERHLPTNLTKETANELRQSYGGTLLQREPNDLRKPYQLQSSLWIGAVLKLGGLKPEVPTQPKSSPSSAPDYLVENGTRHYGVEVKRPSGWAALELTHLAKADSQLAARGVEGAVVVDLSDLVRENYSSYEMIFVGLLGRLETTIADAQTSKEPRYRQFMIAFAYTKNAYIVNATGSLITIGAAAGYAPFVGQARTLRRWHAEWLGDSIARGMGNNGSDIQWQHG